MKLEERTQVLTYEVQCGDIDAYTDAISPGEAFRESAVIVGEDCRFAELARWRIVRLIEREDNDTRVQILSNWFYQNPEDLMGEP